ncbi:hypothetical protein ACM39_04940 [Chryseobacterium sp. FH2]|uniref:PCC domain-containing protein n=1 Tax=Chryseobacterium sp. FH2 TaxID=1674291 RepID=UPI00065AE746|nr:PPC domain-containing DNA-binding protein [Chryseobacterium sp. FH2]KMQ69428.1 hypothetical protein ACM39_04940 [Chryseobacterium sp. FH2]
MNFQTLYGDFWTARKIENTFIVNLKEKVSIRKALTDFILNQNIQDGKIAGIGNISNVKLRFLNPLTKKFFNVKLREQIFANFTGNILNKENAPILNLDVTLENENKTLAGQLLDAQILNDGQFFFHPSQSQSTSLGDNDNINLV